MELKSKRDIGVRGHSVLIVPLTELKCYENAVGGVAVGGMAAHGLVNGMSGASPTGMREANLPRLHLRRARYRP